MKKLKKYLALFLTFSMLSSMLQLPVFAADDNSQLMNGWFQLNKDNSVKGTTTEEVYKDLGFELSKTIKQTGENAFDITLKVVTSQTVTTSDAAIQLVIDTSSSMDYCSVCGKQQTSGGMGGWPGMGGYYPGMGGNNSGSCSCGTDTDNRLTAVKKILTEDGGFLDSLVEANTGAINVSVVAYDLNAETVYDWVDIKDSDNLEAVKDAINDLNDMGNGTNTHAGLMLAGNRLEMSEVANSGVKYTILLTDGYANCVGRESDSTSQISLSGSSPSSVNATTAGTNGAKNMIADLSAESTVFVVGYGVEASYLEGIVDGKGTIIVGEDADTISEAFEDVAESAVAGMNGSGTSVTDPMGGSGSYTMGQYIVLGNVSNLADKGVTSTDGALSWELNPENAKKETVGDTTTYTYEITYPITLDTAAKGFEEGKYYPTNGYTYLSVPTDEGIVEIPFNVPGVSGQVPMVDWSVEYYLQGADGTYTLDDSDDCDPVKAWTPVSAPEGYATKYENYTFVNGQNLEMKVDPKSDDNVIRLYYDRTLVPVTVNHFYKTDIVLSTGEVVTGTYPTTPVTQIIEGVKAGTTYIAEPVTTFGGYQYELVQADSITAIEVSATGENVINMYYSRQDNAITSARVDYVYTTYAYEIVNGKYELKEQSSFTESEDIPEVRATTVIAVDPTPLHEGFELDQTKGDYEDLIQENGTLSFVAVEDPEDNVRTLYYELISNEINAVQVTVNHNYTKTITSIVDGEVVTNTYTGKYTETEDAYAGEAFTAVEINKYEGDKYVSDPGNEAKLVIEQLPAEGASIDLYYTLVVTPEKTDITVNHYWRIFTEVTEELTQDVTDPETGEVIDTVVIGTKTETVEELAHKITENNVVYDLYVGQKYTAAKESWGEGYTFNKTDSNRTIVVEGDDVINMYYDLFLEADEREDADIDVIHNYTTYLTTVVGGKVETITVPDGSQTEQYDELKAGDEFTVDLKTKYNNNEYKCITDAEELVTVLQPATNGTIVVNYERKISNLVPATYKVNYVYNTYKMTVNESGVAGYWDAPESETTSIEGSGSVGQHIEIPTGEKDGFVLVSRSTMVLVLEETENVKTFVYEKRIPLETATVTVNHHYKTTTITVNNTTSESYVLGATTQKVEGELVKAQAANTDNNGFELVKSVVDGIQTESVTPVINVTVSGDIVVDFYYEKVVDQRELTTVTISHVYERYTWDGKWDSTFEADPIVRRGFVGARVTASPDPNYELIESTYNDSELAPPYSVILQKNDNNHIVFVYKQHLAPKNLDVKVIHNYYDTAADIDENDPLKTDMEVKAVPEGKVFTAKERLVDGFRFYSADPEEMSITVDDVDANGAPIENVIVINYVATAEYKVVHIYKRNNIVEEGTESIVLSGLNGEVIEADDIAREPVYNGKTYTFKSISGDITLDADEIQTITLVYNRTTGGNIIPEPPVIEPPVIEIPEEDVPLVEIPEVEIPVTDLPEEDIPLADVPKTGDATALWMAMNALSGAALAGVSLLGRKKREDEEI